MQTLSKPRQSRIPNSKLVVPFANSTRRVFNSMVMPTTVLKPRLTIGPQPCDDVSAIIGFSGAIVGSVALRFGKKTARELVEAFSGTAVELDSPDFADAVGELANIIAGSAKKDLGGLARITVPTVIIGPGHVIARQSGVPCVVIPCRTAVGDFLVEVNIKPKP